MTTFDNKFKRTQTMNFLHDVNQKLNSDYQAHYRKQWFDNSPRQSHVFRCKKCSRDVLVRVSIDEKINFFPCKRCKNHFFINNLNKVLSVLEIRDYLKQVRQKRILESEGAVEKEKNPYGVF